MLSSKLFIATSFYANLFQRKEPKRKVTNEYVPAFRSGPYALIVTLYQHNQVIIFL